MGLFQNIFKPKALENNGEDKVNAFQWFTLEDVSQLDALEKISEDKLVVIFKHSVTCGISHMVWHNFKTQIDFDNQHIDMFYLDLKAHRDVSNEVSKRFKVLHQSPQILVLKNREVIHHASHSAIKVDKIKQFLP